MSDLVQRIYSEAAIADRPGSLGRLTTIAIEVKALQKKADALEAAWDMTHFSCSNPDHSEAYRQGAVALGYIDIGAD